MTTIEQRVLARRRPDGRALMYHRWRHLTFLHWEADARQLQATLPDGLTVDTHDGKAYVGLVPFTMDRIRLSRLPAVPGLSASHETNVRTYVVDERGVPGVWFLSLDAHNPVFVSVARRWYGLPYVRAHMSLAQDGGTVLYSSQRARGEGACDVSCTPRGPAVVPEPGSLEFFLVERYSLFSWHRGRLLEGRVSHAPYRIHNADCKVQENIVRHAQIETKGEPVSCLYCPFVEVEVFGLGGP